MAVEAAKFLRGGVGDEGLGGRGREHEVLLGEIGQVADADEVHLAACPRVQDNGHAAHQPQAVAVRGVEDIRVTEDRRR